MHLPPLHADLAPVVELMRNLSLQTDPNQAAHLYGQGLRRFNILPNDRYLSLSRRELERPHFRVTRNSSWKEPVNPWTQPHKLPLYAGGILADILYSNEPAVITDLPNHLTPDDPARELLEGFNLLVALPHFDNGQAINYGILLNRSADDFPFQHIPMMLWQANLWGRATLNLINRQKLQTANDAMDHELRVVADIQHALLPRELPRIDGVQLATHYQTSQRAGGDYYDFFPLPDRQWGILLADVSGHGTPAAVLMAITHAIAHTHPGHPMPPHQLLAFVNAQLARHYTNTNGNFVTAIYAIYNPDLRSLTYATAGHPVPRILRHGQVRGIAQPPAFPLGIHAAETFSDQSLILQPGDLLLFFTDGITDTFNPEGEAFGTERLDAAMRARTCRHAAHLIDAILADLHAFAQSAPVTDDRTLLAMSLD